MDRLAATLLLLLIVAVTGLGVVVYRADQHARESSRELLCIERAHATASIALMVPAGSVDRDGRIKSLQTLSQRLDAC